MKLGIGRPLRNEMPGDVYYVTTCGCGNRTRDVHDAAGRQVRTQNPLGKIATSIYDEANRLKANIDALGNRTSYAFDAADQRVRTQNALGKIATTVFDPAGRTKASIDPLGNRMTSVFDVAERPLATVDPLGKRMTTIYDEASRPIATVNPLGYRTSLIYDVADQRIAKRDANNNRTTTVFDASGTPVATIDALGARTTQVFDVAGRRIAVVDAKGNRTSFTWDHAGRNTRQTDALGRRTTYAHDAASRPRYRTDARGNRTTYPFDDAGRLTGRRYPDGSRVTFALDALGQRTKMHDANGRTTYTHDDVGRLRSVTNPANKNITYVYDAIGQRRYMQEPEGGRFTTAYDDAGRIGFLVNPQGYRTTWSYDAADRVKVQYLWNSTRASYSYDDANRLLKLANIRSDATTISSFDYAYDSVGNRTRVIESDGIRVTWSYDTKYQLTRERRNGGNAYDITYSYDSAGNRRTKLEDAIRTTYAYDPANQIRYTEDNTGRTTYTFDAIGNQRIVKTPAGALTTNTWDSENKLTKVLLASGTRNTFAYDADGKRVKKEDSNGTSKFVWDHTMCLQETDGNDLVTAVFCHRPSVFGGLISQRRGADTTFHFFDGIECTRQLADSVANVTATYAYKAYGTLVVSTGNVTNPHTFGGRLGYRSDLDAVNYYVVARYLSPLIGRWMSRDPRRPAGARAYPYCANRPLTFVDPSGTIDVRLDLPFDPVPLTVSCVSEDPTQNTPEENAEADPSQGYTEPLPGAWDQKCKDKVSQLIANSPCVARVWESIGSRGCRLPQINCACCHGPYYRWTIGYYRPWANDIFLCWNKVANADPTFFERLLIHELTHAFQTCTMPVRPPGCKESLRREMEAYYCAGQCSDFRTCLYLGLGSACGSNQTWQCQAEDLTPALLEDLYWWFWNSLPEGCPIPTPAHQHPQFQNCPQFGSDTLMFLW